MTLEDVQNSLKVIYWKSAPGTARDLAAQAMLTFNDTTNALIAKSISDRSSEFSNVAAQFSDSVKSLNDLLASVKKDVAFSNAVADSVDLLEKAVSTIPL
jgi:hypothetical protein